MAVSSRNAFTSLEIAIIVSFLLLTAVVVIPQFSEAGQDDLSQELANKVDLVRAQLQIYSMHHDGKFPVDFVSQMTRRTDREGNVMSEDDDPLDYSFGPYLQIVPSNPYATDLSRARTVGIRGDDTVGPGWVYDPESGRFSAVGVDVPNYPVQ